MKAGFLALAILAGSVFAGSANAIETIARSAMIIDHESGTVLLRKNAEAPMPPASMSKLMTLYMVFEALAEGRLSLTDEFRVSTKAWQMGGSKMFLREGQSVSIENLIHGVIVQSGNDACIVLAEGLAGTEEEFARRMTIRARELGMLHSTFANSNGWPDPDHLMSAEDLVTLATRIIRDFPQYYPYFSEESFEWADIVQENRNPLLGLGIGVDGLKTGHTEAAGYGLVASAIQDGRRVTLMVSGLNSASERLQESEKLLNWAFREFFSQSLYEKDQTVIEADVWLGEVKKVALVPETDLNAVVPYFGKDDVKLEVVYQSPIEAPIEAGQKLADLVVTAPEIGETRYPLVAGASVPRGGFVRRVEASAEVLLRKALQLGADTVAETVPTN
jgi:serine-type D-Ala-D-Ala carboxypeptidase (penicillin-binding protein 5/6)